MQSRSDSSEKVTTREFMLWGNRKVGHHYLTGRYIGFDDLEQIPSTPEFGE